MSGKKIVLVTGGNTGLGYECCLALAKQPNTHVIVAGRSQQRIDEAVAKIKAEADPSSIVEDGIIDLASLASVRAFAEHMLERKLEFFSIVCNGGVQVKTKSLTVDGFEQTFGINHLGHFLLMKLLYQHTQRVIMLGSETHDPAEGIGMATPNVSNLDELARGYETFDGMEAYSTSKLCNILFAKEFVRRYPDGPKIFAYTPGYTPDTDLFRNAPHPVVKPGIQAVSHGKGLRMSTPAYSGGYMAKLAAEEPLTPDYANGAYIRLDEPWEASALANDPRVAKELWEKSEAWVSLK